MEECIGFVGLGIMGTPMALRLADAGTPLLVWNRSPESTRQLAAAGAEVATSVEDVFARSRTVILMLRNEQVIDAVLRTTPDTLPALARDHVIVNMGTVSPAFAAALAADVEAAGGAYVEAPVSGSRRPAENGELVAMVAGRAERVAEVVPLLEPMCGQITRCGPVPGGITMKLAVNVFLIAVVTGLAESFHFAEQHGLDTRILREVLDAGQMSSPISRVKSGKLVDADLSPQAAISDVLMNAELVVQAARAADIASPLLDVARDLYAEAATAGDGAIDMVGVIHAITRRDSAHEEAVQDHRPGTSATR